MDLMDTQMTEELQRKVSPKDRQNPLNLTVAGKFTENNIDVVLSQTS